MQTAMRAAAGMCGRVGATGSMTVMGSGAPAMRGEVMTMMLRSEMEKSNESSENTSRRNESGSTSESESVKLPLR